MKFNFRQSSILFMATLAIAIATIISCRKNTDVKVPVMHINKSNDKYAVDYQSSTSDSVLHIELKIAKTGEAAEIVKEDIDIDLKGNKYLYNIYDVLQKKSSDSRYTNITLQQAGEMCFALREVISQATKSLTSEQIKSPNIQGMYISLSFARRILKNKMPSKDEKIIDKKMALKTMATSSLPVPNQQPSFAQDVFQGYELGLTSFAMNDDIMVNKQAFLTIVNNDISMLPNDDKGLYVFQDVLNSISASNFTLKYLFAQIDAYIKQHPENYGSGNRCAGGWWPSGSSHGCCGNYNGCCWYWHPACYVHDIICANCKPAWFCLSGCKPDVKYVHYIEPFYVIEDYTPVETGEGIHLPLPLPTGIYYKQNYNDMNIIMLQFYTPIFINPANSKYYSDNQYNNLLPNGYYDSPSESNGIDHTYYNIVNGSVLKRYRVFLQT